MFYFSTWKWPSKGRNVNFYSEIRFEKFVDLKVYFLRKKLFWKNKIKCILIRVQDSPERGNNIRSWSLIIILLHSVGNRYVDAFFFNHRWSLALKDPTNETTVIRGWDIASAPEITKTVLEYYTDCRRNSYFIGDIVYFLFLFFSFDFKEVNKSWTHILYMRFMTDRHSLFRSISVLLLV